MHFFLQQNILYKDICHYKDRLSIEISKCKYILYFNFVKINTVIPFNRVAIKIERVELD